MGAQRVAEANQADWRQPPNVGVDIIGADLVWNRGWTWLTEGDLVSVVTASTPLAAARTIPRPVTWDLMRQHVAPVAPLQKAAWERLGRFRRIASSSGRTRRLPTSEVCRCGARRTGGDTPTAADRRTPGPADGAPMLTVHEVSKTFPATRRAGEVVALQAMSFTVGAGEFVALVGPSGCGKSTLLNMIAGIDRPTSGQITARRHAGRRPEPATWRDVPAVPAVPWMTVRANIEFGPRSRGEARERCRAIADKHIALVGLDGFESRYPHELSGGMQQRCALARVLANDPILLLMDEPLAAVDAQTRSILQEELLAIWGEDRPAAARKTVVFVTHAIEEAAFLADRILVMGRRPGRLIADIVNDLPRPGSRRAAARASESWSTRSGRCCTTKPPMQRARSTGEVPPVATTLARSAVRATRPSRRDVVAGTLGALRVARSLAAATAVWWVAFRLIDRPLSLPDPWVVAASWGRS
jgi:ABC-type nitrate/sulfonate/bicarbonate transport system ATPase subunit